MFYNNLLIFIIIFLETLLSTDGHAACPAYGNTEIKARCRTSSVEPARRNEFYQNNDLSDSFFTLFQKESFQKIEALQKDSAFLNAQKN